MSRYEAQSESQPKPAIADETRFALNDAQFDAFLKLLDHKSIPTNAMVGLLKAKAPWEE